MTVRAMIYYDLLPAREKEVFDLLASITGLSSVDFIDVFLDAKDFAKEKLGLDFTGAKEEKQRETPHGGEPMRDKKYLREVRERLLQVDAEYFKKRAETHRIVYEKYVDTFISWLAAVEAETGLKIFEALEAYIERREEAHK